MENLEDLSKTFKAALYERSKSPFYLTFVLSWAGWNWRFLYFLFSDDLISKLTFEQKITFINDNYINVYNNLLNPLWTSAVVFICGSLLTLIFLAGKNGSTWIKRKFIDGIEPFDREREKLIREQLLKEEKRINDMVLSINKDLDIYKKQNFDLETDAARFNDEKSELEKTILHNGKNSEQLEADNEKLKKGVQELEDSHELNVKAIIQLEKEKAELTNQLELSKNENIGVEEEILQDELMTESELFKDYKGLKQSDLFLTFISVMEAFSLTEDGTIGERGFKKRLYSSSFRDKGLLENQIDDEIQKMKILSYNKKYNTYELNNKGKQLCNVFYNQDGIDAGFPVFQLETLNRISKI